MIGARLHELRTNRNLSLRDLGSATGLSATLLSQIERGVTQPSLKSLRLLADYFGQSVADLFQEPWKDDAVLTRPGERQTVLDDESGLRYERLTHGNGRLEVLHGTMQPGDSSGLEPRSHDAVECAYVLSGELTVEIGEEVFTLVAGEAITLNSLKPHRYCNRGEDVTEFTLSVTPPTP
ncbi:XRE family transcriptional regulator [Ornithinimicrobium humiphilum]|uniref:XRE family transcriptional regulator n=1 Tax=Ornithinimicrobium humiphilum TaxID=125288 RepID=A0A543KMK2_9MICO|nr:XRE family transcriptional regulator [Ornithinimicrobium humiphilum]TQM96310.1 XRE family transcriptional regulator [Ornithinimicrobium humiphilum]